MSFPDDDLEQEGATRDWRFLKISGINDVIEYYKVSMKDGNEQNGSRLVVLP
jgi:hypothetical protein